MHYLLNSGASLIVGFLVAVLWHWRCSKKKWASRRQDYVWAFIEGGVSYVMLALLFSHYFWDIPYAQTMTDGFGETQVNVAFLGALYESVHALLDLWNGNAMAPTPHV